MLAAGQPQAPAGHAIMRSNVRAQTADNEYPSGVSRISAQIALPPQGEPSGKPPGNRPA